METSPPIDESSKELRIGAIASPQFNFGERCVQFTVPADHRSFESLKTLYDNGERLKIILSSPACQLPTWDRPKVSIYRFSGRIINAEKVADGTALKINFLNEPEQDYVEV